MSLMDAMLLEGYRDPRDVYIALRSDGARGSGTINDPYDGSVVSGPSIGLSSVTWNSLELFVAFINKSQSGSLLFGSGGTIGLAGVTGLSASIFNKPNHPVVAAFENGVVITVTQQPLGLPRSHDHVTNDIAGMVHLLWPLAKATCTQANACKPYEVVTVSDTGVAAFNGTFVLLTNSTAQTEFRYLLASIPGAPSASSGQCARRIHRFDEVMRALPGRSVLHIGPGTFDTRGSAHAYISNLTDYDADPYQGFAIKAGQKIRGSGMGATVLRIVHATDRKFNTIAFASRFHAADGFELHDLTIDCNLSGQPIPAGEPFAQVACGATSIPGSHIRLRRVRAIHAGTQSGEQECFTLGVGWGTPNADRANCVVEDCVIEAPSENNVRESSNFAVMGTLTGLYRACVIRHCLMDAAFADGTAPHPVGVKPTLLAGSGPRRVKVQTMTPHRRTEGSAVVLNGFYTPRRTPEGNWTPQGLEAFAGAFPVEAVNDATEFEIELKQEPDYVFDVSSAKANGQFDVESFEAVIAASANSADWLQYRVGIAGNHPFDQGDPISLSGVKVPMWNAVAGGWEFRADSGLEFNDAFTAAANSTYDPAFDRTFVLFTLAETPLFAVNHYLAVSWNATIGVGFHSFGVHGGTAAVCEKNWSFNAVFAYYCDTGSTKNAIVRDNVFANCYAGIYLPIGSRAEKLNVTSTLAHEDDVATCTTSSAHYLWKGIMVEVSGITNPEAAPYNGIFEVIEVPTQTRFKYQMKGIPTAAPQGTIRLQVVSTSRHSVLERNFVQIAPGILSNAAPALGIAPAYLDGTVVPVADYIHKNLRISNNVVGQMNSVPDSRAVSIFFGGCQETICAQNLVRLPLNATPLLEFYSRVTHFENQHGGAFAGTYKGLGLLQHGTQEARTDIEAALLLSL